MDLSFLFGAEGEDGLEVVWKDSERVVRRGTRLDADGRRRALLAVLPAAQHPTPASLDRLAHEYGLRDELDPTWAVRPLALIQERGRRMLVLEDPSGEVLEGLLGRAMELERFLRLALGLAEAVAGLHRRALVHKDLKPAHILVDPASCVVRLTGFGITSRLARERQPSAPPEEIAGTLAYMAPEQTGRMNRSIDARSDLYALGVIFYQMLTGALPFTASDPLEWVHCHIARQPVSPAERLDNIPETVSAIVMKLLAKTAEARYQTAAGLVADLRRCLGDWETHRRVEAFPLGAQDLPNRLLIPEKLYGREREIETLLAAFDQMVAAGAPELVLVSGYSGIGKSSVVNELRKVLVPPRGLFAAGKFDQLKRDIPYATLAQALQGLIRPLLAKSAAELAPRREALAEALDPNGRLMVDLVPELEPLIGPQPPAPELPPQDAQRRFQLVFRRLLGVFAQPNHPLALFLDDLQWLDAATLDLLEHLATQPELRHLLVVGAYRDNEVTPTHPLMQRLAAIRQAGGRVQEIVLAPLGLEDLGRLVVDALHCEPERAAPLAWLVHEKTAGNPFFAIQFLTALADEGLLHFDHGEMRWAWNIQRIHAKGYADNIAALLVSRLHRLPVETQNALQQLACLGTTAAIPMLAIALGTTEEQIHADLWAAAREQLVLRLNGAYQFVHDRVQEAAYSLIPAEMRGGAHLRIGRRLLAETRPERREEAIFEIVNQLNRGVALITEVEEREQLAELNRVAGQRAMASTAYASALAYVTAGATLLGEDCWEQRHELAFALELNRAECEFLTGALTEAEARLAALSARAADTTEQAIVACLRIDLHTTLTQPGRAVAVGLDYLRQLGVEWSTHPTADEVRREYEPIWSQLGARTIEELVNLPLMSDPSSLATLDVLNKLAPPAYFTDANLLALVACRAVNLSLERGNCDSSCVAYELLGLIAGSRFDDYQAACRFGRLGYDLVEQRGLRRFRARTYHSFAIFVLPWAKHVKTVHEMLRRAFDVASKIGDLTFVAYSCHTLNECLLLAGDPLVEVEREAEHGLALTQKMRMGLSADVIAVQLQLIRTLRGLSPKFGTSDETQFGEPQLESRLQLQLAPDRRVGELRWHEYMYRISKLRARFFAGDYASAIEAASRAQELLWTSLTTLETAEYHFYGALSRAAIYDSALPEQRRQHLEILAAHHRQLAVWAERCPENFENRAALVGAEIARIEGRVLDAEHLYEQAIGSARANGFVHNEALANELAARFYAARGFEKIARVYLRDARYGYLRWGADGKVRQLDEMYPDLREEERAQAPTGSIGAPVEHLDLATVLKVSQAVSGETVLEKLIEALMRVAIEHAGATRGLLILHRADEPRIEAEAVISGDKIIVQVRDEPAAGAALPESIVRFVARTHESVILDDASTNNPFAADPYFSQHPVRSVLCLPLTDKARLTGLLYLENDLAPRVFTPNRIAVLKLLASQAAISLENTRLYSELQEREAKVRRLVDSNIIGIYIWDFRGRIIDANDAFLDIVGYSREDLISGRLYYTALTPPEWDDVSEQARSVVKTTGTASVFEKEYLRKDGSRVPILLGGATFGERQEQGVAFVLDLTQRKRAEETMRQMQMELAHANRVATMGQLSASIAHEVSQPISATVANAQAGRRWLDRQPPDLEELRQVLDRIVRDGNRASDVITRIRALIKKAPSRSDRVDVNEAIGEVIALSQGEAAKNGVAVRTDLAAGLPLIEGDRVQLQQVVLNLVVNAIQAMSALRDGGRELLIGTTMDVSGTIVVAVRDTGPGLDPSRVDHLFKAFYTTKPDGMGMGLAICRSIIEAHGGRLWACANEPRGAVFQFTLQRRSDTSVLGAQVISHGE